MRFFRLTTLILGSLASFQLSAAGEQVTAVIERGLAAYAKDGPDAAIKEWVKGSSFEGNVQALTQANALRQVQDFYGAYEGYEVLLEHPLSSRIHFVLVVMQFSKGPLFARFQMYQKENSEWIATEFKFHTDATMIYPTSIVFGESEHNEPLEPTR